MAAPKSTMTASKSTKRRKSPGRARSGSSASDTAVTMPGEVAVPIIHTANAPCIRLEAGLEIKDAEGVHRLLLEALGQGGAITVDVGGVQTVDTAGAQLLVAFQCEAGRRGVTVEFSGESAPLTHTLSVLGLREKLTFAVSHG